MADVYDAVTALGGRRFDVVYTGTGALVWLPDMARWAGVVAALSEPGGFLYLVTRDIAVPARKAAWLLRDRRLVFTGHGQEVR